MILTFGTVPFSVQLDLPIAGLGGKTLPGWAKPPRLGYWEGLPGGRQITMPTRFHIPDHLILPFGTAQKFDIERIKLSSAGANGIYFTSDIPCVYIDRSKKRPLTLFDFTNVFPITDLDLGSAPEECRTNVIAGLDFIHEFIRKFMPSPTKFDIRFLQLYFDHIKGKSSGSSKGPRVAYNAMLPIPEMQVYVHDPLVDDWTAFEPTNNFRVDFGFWTGTQLVAVEIDGHEPEGYSQDVRRDRLLRRADVDVIHILNTEIMQHSDRVIGTLLPDEIAADWCYREAQTRGPIFP
jgi:hypothetical protein